MSRQYPEADQGTAAERFEYYMIRLTRSEQEPARVAGLVERLGSGEKRSFDTGEQLIRMVGGWIDSSLNLQPALDHGNAGDPSPSPSGDSV